MKAFLALALLLPALASAAVILHAQLTISNTSGPDPSLPAAPITGGKTYTLPVESGTMRHDFRGQTGCWQEFETGPPFSDAGHRKTLKTAGIDTTSPFTAVYFLQGTL